MSAISAFSGVEKKGGELYQITVGGDATENAAVGDILGHGFVAEDVPDAIERLVDTYISQREKRRRAVHRGLSPARRSAVQGGALWQCLDLAFAPRQAGQAARARHHGAQRHVRRDGRRRRAAPGGDRTAAGRSGDRLVVRRGLRRCCCTWWRRSTRPCRSISSRPASTFAETLRLCRDAEEPSWPDQCALRCGPTPRTSRGSIRMAICGRPIRIRAAISARPSRSTPRSRSIGGWVTGRKRYQTAERGVLPHFELTSDDRIKVNPLAYFSDADVNAYKIEHGLPEHPLFAKGYKSIGCAPARRSLPRARTRAPAAGAGSTRKSAASISTSTEQSPGRWPQWKRTCSRTAPSSPIRSAPGPRATIRRACATRMCRCRCSSRTATRCWPIRIRSGCWCRPATRSRTLRRDLGAVCLGGDRLPGLHRWARLFERPAAGRALQVSGRGPGRGRRADGPDPADAPLRHQCVRRHPPGRRERRWRPGS